MVFSFQEIFPTLLIFARMGPALSLLPGLNASFLNKRIRLFFAFTFSLMLAFPLRHQMPPLPSSDLALGVLLAQEIMIGIFLGMLVRVLFYALEVVGQIFSFQSGFAAAQVFNPFLGAQGGVYSGFFILTGTTLIFVTDLYQVIITNLVESYHFFDFVQPVPYDSLAQLFIRFMGDMFMQAVQLSIPVLTIITVFFIGIGLLSRFIPTVQIFFVSLPMQVFLGLSILLVSMAGLFGLFLEYFDNHLRMMRMG